MEYQSIIEHHIQREILQRLATKHVLRFSELKPHGMESNIFMYHTTALRRAGLLHKQPEGYTLTPQGLRYVDRLSSQSLRPRMQPKIIAVLLIKNSNNQVAMLKRRTAPYAGSYMLPSGKMHFGETLSAHAARELLEKTGLDVPLLPCGTASIAIGHDEAVITHAVAIVWKANLANMPQLTCADERFDVKWHNATDSSHDYLPGTLELLARAEEGVPFVADMHYISPLEMP